MRTKSDILINGDEISIIFSLQIRSQPELDEWLVDIDKQDQETAVKRETGRRWWTTVYT